MYRVIDTSARRPRPLRPRGLQYSTPAVALPWYDAAGSAHATYVDHSLLAFVSAAHRIGDAEYVLRRPSGTEPVDAAELLAIEPG